MEDSIVEDQAQPLISITESFKEHALTFFEIHFVLKVVVDGFETCIFTSAAWLRKLPTIRKDVEVRESVKKVHPRFDFDSHYHDDERHERRCM